jgi:hypothetical protein
MRKNNQLYAPPDIFGFLKTAQFQSVHFTGTKNIYHQMNFHRKPGANKMWQSFKGQTGTTARRFDFVLYPLALHRKFGETPSHETPHHHVQRPATAPRTALVPAALRALAMT